MKKRHDVLEWINKAEQDYQMALVMARKRLKGYRAIGYSDQDAADAPEPF